jgi:hypothetical protein
MLAVARLDELDGGINQELFLALAPIEQPLCPLSSAEAPLRGFFWTAYRLTAVRSFNPASPEIPAKSAPTIRMLSCERACAADPHNPGAATMSPPSRDLTRRTFLQATAAGLTVPGAATAGSGKPLPTPRSRPPARPAKPRRRLAVITTAYYYLSHAYHICGRVLHGYLRGDYVNPV